MNLVIVGNDANWDWRKVHGLAAVRHVVSEILDVLGAEGHGV